MTKEERMREATIAGVLALREVRRKRLQTIRACRLLDWLPGAIPRGFIVFQRSDLLALRRP